MGKTRRITPVDIEMLREIEKHPSGTPPGVIYKHFDSRTWEVLKKPDRKNNEILTAGEVFQLLSQLVQNPKMFEKVEETVEKKQVEPCQNSKLKSELDYIIEDAMHSFNTKLQNAIEEISETVFDEIREKFNDLSKKEE